MRLILAAIFALAIGSAASAETVMPLKTDTDSFQARVTVLQDPGLAELEFTTYTLTNDEVGSAFMALLRQAALRGVKVRGIVDDVIVNGSPELMSVLKDAGVELRFYSPIDLLPWMILHPVEGYEHLDHRMHDKLFIAKFTDGREAVIQGDKNYDNLYFQHTNGLFSSTKIGFLGREAYAEGGMLASDSRAYFETLWASKRVRTYTFGSLMAKFKASERRRLDAYIEWADKYAAGKAWMNSRVEVAQTEFLHNVSDAGQTISTLEQIFAKITNAPAGSKIFIENAYFVMHPALEKALKAAVKNGCKITVLTNSLASTDEPMVAVALMKSLPKLRDIGVELYVTPMGQGLHSKMTLIGDTVILGSANFDPRSLQINSESAAVFESPQMAAYYRSLIPERLATASHLIKNKDIDFTNVISPWNMIPSYLKFLWPFVKTAEELKLYLFHNEI